MTANNICHPYQAKKQLQLEVSAFVPDFLRMLKAKLTATPTGNGVTPTDLLAAAKFDASVCTEASSFIYGTQVHGVESVRLLQNDLAAAASLLHLSR